jgi:23S rRNA pseudouridine2604 synthase
MDQERLSKIMAARGMCSRREADRYIERGLVLVDGEVVSELGTKVSPNAQIELAEAGRKRRDAQATFLINKPIGYVSGQPEDGYKAAVELISGKTRWKDDRLPRKFNPTQLRGLAPAGRLDIDSTGLLVLTQDGRVARRIIGEDSDVDKEYLVRVEGRLSAEGLKLLNHGLELDGKPLKPAKVGWQNEDQLRFILHEGKKRQIRRMCELVGLKVVGLKRIRIGKVVLGNLPNGQWRYLRDDESF